MRVGIVVLYCGRSGKKGFYNRQEIGLAKALAQLDYECCVFYPDKTATNVYEETASSGVRVIYVPVTTIGVHARFNWHILLNYDLDVVQINSDNQLFAPSLSAFCDRHGIRQYHYIGTINSDSHGWKAAFMQIAKKRRYRMLRHNKCFAKTPALAAQLEANGIKNIHVVPVGLDESCIPEIEHDQMKLRRKLGLPSDKTILLYVGRIDAYKNPLLTVELMKRLDDHYYMVIIGAGRLSDELADAIDENALVSRIKRIEAIPNSEIHHYYGASDYFVNFNQNEIFGMSILEAMYNGCCVIAYHAPGPDYILGDSEMGILVSDMEEMVNRIQENKRIDREAVERFARSKFNWSCTILPIIEWINQNDEEN